MAHPHPFRFGVFGESIRSRAELIGTARAAEARGYATFLLRDHFIAEPFGHQLGPLAGLATVAAVTERLRIGSMVFANDYRPPVMLAKEAATLDVLSGGRFEFGIGTGFLRAEYDQAGIVFDAPGVRVARFAEALQVYKGLFAGKPFTFSGQFYRIEGCANFPVPIQRPHPPIVVGAGGRRMLALAAREADGIELLTTSTANGTLLRDPATRLASAVARQIGWIREAAGARFAAIELSTVIAVVISERRREAAERFARDRGWDGVTPADILAMPTVFIGSADEIVAAMQERREHYGFSYYIIADREMESVAPIVARLTGS